MQATVTRSAGPALSTLAMLMVLVALVLGGIAGYGIRSLVGIQGMSVRQSAPALDGSGTPSCQQEMGPSFTC